MYSIYPDPLASPAPTESSSVSTTYTYATPSYFYIVPVLCILSGIISFLLIVRRYRSRQRFADPLQYLPSPEYTLDHWERKVGAEVEEREIQMAAKTLGEQVWFSRYLYGGVPSQWLFIVHGSKFELRSNLSAGSYSYSYNSGPSTLAEEEERANLAEMSNPEVDGYHMCLIGWTKMTPERVWMAFEQCQKKYGKESLPGLKCGVFMQAFACKIIHTSAIDRRWLGQNTQSFFRSNGAEGLPKVPTALLTARLQSQQQMLLGHQGDEETRAQLARNIALNRQLLNGQIPSAVNVNPPTYSRGNWHNSESSTHFSSHTSGQLSPSHQQHHQDHAIASSAADYGGGQSTPSAISSGGGMATATGGTSSS